MTHDNDAGQAPQGSKKDGGGDPYADDAMPVTEDDEPKKKLLLVGVLTDPESLRT